MILEPPESVQKLQTALQAKAKGLPGYRFYLLYDKLYRKDVLEYAYQCCKANHGAPGVDRPAGLCGYRGVRRRAMAWRIGGQTPQEDVSSGGSTVSVDTEAGRKEAPARYSLPRRSDGDDGSGGGAYTDLRSARRSLVFSAGENPAPERGKPPHRESSLGLMEVTTWVKRRQSDGRAVT